MSRMCRFYQRLLTLVLFLTTAVLDKKCLGLLEAEASSPRWIPPAPYEHFSVDMKSNPKVMEAISIFGRKIEEMIPKRIDVYANYELIGHQSPELELHGGMLAFCLANGDFKEGLNVTYTMVIDRQGNIAALRWGDSYSYEGELYSRHYEALKPFNSSTLLMIAHDTKNESVNHPSNRILLWDFVTGNEEFVPYNGSQSLDDHDIQYLPQTDSFLVQEETSETSRLINWCQTTRENLWVLDFRDLDIPDQLFQSGMHINKFQMVNDNLLMANSRNQGIIYLIHIDDTGNSAIIARYGGLSSDAEFYDLAGNHVSQLWERFTHNTEVFFHLNEESASAPHTFVTYDNNAGWNGSISTTRFLEFRCKTENHQLICHETWVWETGDKSSIFGDADYTPSGNILGPSWGTYADPSDPNQQGYHCHIFEVNKAKGVAWSLNVKPYWLSWMGSNPTEAYPRHNEEAPIGWSLYSVENIYSEPIIKNLAWDYASDILRFIAFNTHRTSHISPALVRLYSEFNTLIKSKKIELNKMWIPTQVEIDVSDPTIFQLLEISSHMYVELENEWGYVSRKKIIVKHNTNPNQWHYLKA